MRTSSGPSTGSYGHSALTRVSRCGLVASGSGSTHGPASKPELDPSTNSRASSKNGEASLTSWAVPRNTLPESSSRDLARVNAT